MKKPFEIGDAVMVYDTEFGSGMKAAGEVTAYMADRGEGLGDLVTVRFPFRAGSKSYARQQCRRLKPKTRPQKKGPRHFWIRHDRYGHPTAVAGKLIQKQQEDDAVIECTELTPDSRVVTRGELAKAWNEAKLKQFSNWAPHDQSAMFSLICEALGFEGEKYEPV